MQRGIVFIAPLGTRNKKANIFDEIVSLCPESDYSSVLYITPSAFSQRETRRQFFSYLKNVHKKNVYIPFQSFTLTNLCTDFYETFNPPPPPFKGGFEIISGRIEPLVLCEILGEKNIGYASLLSDLLRKIRHYILNKELSQIKDEIKSLIFEEKTMKRAARAIEILQAYEKELEGKGLITLECAVRNSITLIKEHIGPSIFVIDGFFDPTPLELEVLNALIKKADKAYVLVEENAEFLRFFESDGHEFEKRRLKSSHHRETAGYYPYPSMEEEVEGIAKGVKALIIEGVMPNEIIVSFPVLSKYLLMLKRVFQKYGIPISVAEYNLANTKPFMALEDMIASIENDYPRNEFLSFLTSPHFPETPEILKEWAVSFSNKAGIIKGKQSWLSIKERLVNSTEEEISTGMKEAIEKFQHEVRKIIGILEKLRQNENLLTFIDGLEEVLNKFGFFDSLGESSSVLYGNDASNKISSLLSEFRCFADFYNSDKSQRITEGNENNPSSPPLRVMTFSKGGRVSAEIGIEEAGFYLRHLLKNLKGSAEDMNGVRVVPFEFATGLESKAMFFGGMIEGEFPSKPGIDPIMPEKVKEVLGLPFLEYYLNRQKRYFKRLLNVSSDEPYFSYPVTEGDKMFLPSPLLDWGRSVSPLSLNISTEEEILINKGAVKQRNFSDILWDGELPHNKDVMSLLRQGPGAKIFFSVTDIDAYRQCPLRFYIEKILRLEIEKPPKFEVEAKLWGKLAHKTMEYLYKGGGIELEDIEKRIFEGLESSLNQFPIGDFWSRVAREIFKKLLPILKERETEIRMKGFSPYLVEKTIRASVNNLNLRGKIDRIDRGTQNTVILLDYKTGSIDKDSLQLPLYAAMWQIENTQSVEKVGFYSLKDGQVDWYPKRLSVEEFIRDALQTAEKLIQGMRKGIFTPVPFKEGACRYCYHNSLCKGAK
ncbi:MAG: PD-(D/E)XK nuclease family protein [Thermodesulfovibrionia bacterium]|nr:PD-(D/E)XK nuclease family protein [Thermodesulfovibrionia bacterium]